jgi:hypothetical protein
MKTSMGFDVSTISSTCTFHYAGDHREWVQSRTGHQKFYPVSQAIEVEYQYGQVGVVHIHEDPQALPKPDIPHLQHESILKARHKVNSQGANMKSCIEDVRTRYKI